MNHQKLWEDLRSDIKQRMVGLSNASPALVSFVDVLDLMDRLEAIQFDAEQVIAHDPKRRA